MNKQETQLMSKYLKQLAQVMLGIMAITLVGCGGGSDGGTNAESVVKTPLWCQSPQTLNAAGNACELVITACQYPEIADDIGLCVMDTNQWIDGSNAIVMPQPEYIPAANEVVLYWIREDANYDGWGLHAWNNASCNSYSDYEAEGGTSWTVPLQPTGIDTNFGAYWVMNLTDSPNCINLIPHNLEADLQTSDLTIELATLAQNPTNAFFIVDGLEESSIFPFPRTFASTVVPGGSTLSCTAPQILNEVGDDWASRYFGRLPTNTAGSGSRKLRTSNFLWLPSDPIVSQ
jgi:hypothetical protein